MFNNNQYKCVNRKECKHRILDNFKGGRNISDAAFEMNDLNWRSPYREGDPHPKTLAIASALSGLAQANGFSESVFSPIENIFDTLNVALYSPVHASITSTLQGFAHPRSQYETKYEEFDNQLYSKLRCTQWVDKIKSFPNYRDSEDGEVDPSHIPSDNAFDWYFLLGYVGTGKTTLLRYLSAQINRNGERGIFVFELNYDNISKDLYKKKNTQDFWDKEINDLLRDKIVDLFRVKSRKDYECRPPQTSSHPLP